MLLQLTALYTTSVVHWYMGLPKITKTFKLYILYIICLFAFSTIGITDNHATKFFISGIIQ